MTDDAHPEFERRQDIKELATRIASVENAVSRLVSVTERLTAALNIADPERAVAYNQLRRDYDMLSLQRNVWDKITNRIIWVVVAVAILFGLSHLNKIQALIKILAGE